MDCIVHGVAKSRTRLSDFHFHFPRSHGLSFGCELGRVAGHLSWGLGLGEYRAVWEHPRKKTVTGKLLLPARTLYPRPKGLSNPSVPSGPFLLEVRILHKCLEPILSSRDVFVTRVWAQAGSQLLVCLLLREAHCVHGSGARPLETVPGGKGRDGQMPPLPPQPPSKAGNREPLMH